MSLDANLFTLNFAPSKDDPNITDLVDPLDNPHYRKERVTGTEYRINVYEPLSQSLLASATAPHATSKVKFVELHNPSQIVELKYTGTIAFKWRFMWEQHEFEWRREECFMLRKPDPAVLVAVTKEPSGRLRTSSVQILDYNLNRFDINDRKGLEIVILTALLTFQDSNEAHHTPPSVDGSTPPLAPRQGFLGIGRRPSDTSETPAPVSGPPALPPKPAPRVGLQRVTEVHAVRAAQGMGEANEVEVGDDGTLEEYAEYAEGLLRDDAMLFVTVRSATAVHVPKVLQVVEHTKRLRHKAGLDEEQELFQYVIYDTAKKGPKRINLDDPTPAHLAYSPPSSLKIHLSKIDIPELRPRADKNVRTTSTRHNPIPEPMKPPEPPAASDKAQGKQKESEKTHETEKERHRAAEEERKRERERAKELEKMQKKAEKEAKKAEKGKKAPDVNKLKKPTISTPPVAHDSLPGTSLNHSPPRPLSYQPPPPASSYPNFPQPREPSPAAAAFYTGASFPSAAEHNMPPQSPYGMTPLLNTPSHIMPPASPHHRSSSTAGSVHPPPVHPSQRPQSLYGSNTYNNTPYPSFGSSYYPQ